MDAYQRGVRDCFALALQGCASRSHKAPVVQASFLGTAQQDQLRDYRLEDLHRKRTEGAAGEAYFRIHRG